MKNLIVSIFFIMLISCEKNNELESIEIMSYYYNYDENTKLFIEFDEYSKIDENGNVETIKRIEPFKQKYIYLKSKIDSKIIYKIEKDNKLRENKYYEKKTDTSGLHFYDGPIIRVKAKYKNNKKITFTYEKDETDLKYSLFLEIQKAISTNYNKKKYKAIDSINIKKNQKGFEKFALIKDTLNLPMPPKPIDASKQIKFPPQNN